MADTSQELNDAAESLASNFKEAKIDVKDFAKEIVSLAKKFAGFSKDTENSLSNFKKLEKTIAGINSPLLNSLNIIDKRVIQEKELENLSVKLKKALLERNRIQSGGYDIELKEAEATRKKLTDKLKSLNAFAKSLGAEKGYKAKIKDIDEKILEYSKKETINLKEINDLSEQLGKLSIEEQKRKEKEKKENQLKETKLKIQEDLFKSSGKIIGETGKKLVDMGVTIGKLIAEGREEEAILQAISDIVRMSIDRFVEIENEAESFRKTLGLTKDQTRQIEKSALMINQRFGAMGVTLKDSYIAAGELFKTLGNVKVSENMFKTQEAIALLHTNFGVASADAAGFLTQMMKVGHVGESTAVSYASYAASLSKAAGVPLDTVMKDVTKASSETLSILRGNPMELVKATVEARRLGISLETVAKASRSMLNFQESVGEEMEASVLIGKNLTFQRAREKSFLGDIKGAQQEILSTIKKAGDFTKLNVYQQEALAKASGMSVKDINQMLLLDKQLGELTSDQRAEYDNLVKAQQKSIEKTGPQILQQMKMQSALSNLNGTFQNLWNSIADVFTPFVDVFVKTLIPVIKAAAVVINFLLIPAKMLGKVLSNAFESESVQTFIGWANDGLNLFEKWISYASDFGAAIAGPLIQFGIMFKPIASEISLFVARTSGWAASFAVSLGSMGRLVMPFAGWLLKISGFLGKWLSPIGWVITGFQFIMNLVKEFKNSPGGIIEGFYAVGRALKDTLLQPFIDAWDWLSDKFMGNSPSELGLRILDGIKSIGAAIFDAITAPFRSAFNFVSGMFGGPKIPSVTDTLESSTKDDVKNSNKNISQQSPQDQNSIIGDKLDELISLLKNGAIQVNLDGKRVSTVLSIQSQVS